MSSNYRTSASRAAKYDYLIKLLLIGDSGKNVLVKLLPSIIDLATKNI